MDKLNFDPKNVKVVPIDMVRPNAWNPKDERGDEYLKIKKGIEAKGLRLPIVVRNMNKGTTDPLNGYYEIIDGEQRWTACKDLGYDKVIIYDCGEVSESEAKELTIWFQQQVQFNDVQLAKLVTEIASLPDIVLPYSDTEIKEFRELSHFDWDDFKDLGEVGPASDHRSIVFTLEQYEIVQQAIESVKEENQDATEGRCVELICADYLAGARKE